MNNSIQKCFPLSIFILLLLLGISLHAEEKVGASGAVGGANSQGANSQLESCTDSLGTLAVHEDQSANWWHNYYRVYPSLGSTVPVLRMMIQQSNCFVVVERGKAMSNVMEERDLEASGETREGSNFGKGQMVSADYTMSPSIQISENTGGAAGAIGGLLGNKGRILGGIAAKLKKNDASTTLLLIDNRSSVQVSAAQGNASNFDYGGLGAVFGRSAGGIAGAYVKTPEGKTIAAAFADSYNNMVRSLRNYKAQTVEGGLGKGGKLEVGE